MAVSPQHDAEGVIRVTIACDGLALDAPPLLSVVVRHAVSHLPSATLEFQEGDLPTGTFEPADAQTFRPGAEVCIRAGYGSDESPIFEGIVTRLGVRIGGANESRLIVECQDKAGTMTAGRRSRVFVDQTDSDIITSLIGDAGLAARVAPTGEVHAQIVQHDCTDWRFLLARAAAQGLRVTVAGGCVSVQPPAADAGPVLSVTCGVDLIEFAADIERCAALDTGQARQPEGGRPCIRGRMRFAGSARAVVGAVIEVSGVGRHFDGRVEADAVTHEIRDGDWFSTVEFGPASGSSAQHGSNRTPWAGRLKRAAPGLQLGVVSKLDADPAGEHRVQVALPHLDGSVNTVWARLLQDYASTGVGSCFAPEIGDEVVLGQVEGDPACLVILGSLHSRGRPPPHALAAGNPIKAIVTRSQTRIEFDDEDRTLTLRTPGHNILVLSDEDKSLLISDANGNTVTLSEAGITLDSARDITIGARGAITLKATQAVAIGTAGDLCCAGLNVRCEAQVGFSGKGSASAELSAAGVTRVKGALVLID